jgi:hypothetical protein
VSQGHPSEADTSTREIDSIHPHACGDPGVRLDVPPIDLVRPPGLVFERRTRKAANQASDIIERQLNEVTGEPETVSKRIVLAHPGLPSLKQPTR